MKRDLYILGAAGHASDVADVAAAIGYRPIFVTRRQDEIDSWRHKDPIVTEDAALAGEGRDFAIGVGDNRIRAAIAAQLADRVRFPALVHPDTSFGRGTRATAEQARGTVVFAGARFTGGIAIGSFATVNLGATVSHDVDLGDFANLSPGVHVAGNVRIETGAWLGIGVAVNQGQLDRKRVIGAWAMIGSGAVVTADCLPGATYVGVPARRVG